MKKAVLWIVAVILFIIAIVGISFLYKNLTKDYEPEIQKETTTQITPDFTVTDSEGGEVRLSDMKGKPTVVNFWATWCPYCVEELPDFEKIYKEKKDDINFMIVDMTDGERETVKKAEAYINENGYTFPVYYDTAFSAYRAYGVNSLPLTLFIDKDGNLVTYAPGKIDLEGLKKGISMIEGETK